MNSNIFSELLKFNDGKYFTDDITRLVMKYKGYNENNLYNPGL